MVSVYIVNPLGATFEGTLDNPQRTQANSPQLNECVTLHVFYGSSIFWTPYCIAFWACAQIFKSVVANILATNATQTCCNGSLDKQDCVCVAVALIGVSYIIWKVFESTFQKKIPFVCTTIFKWTAGLHFYHKSFMLYINVFVSISSTNKWKASFQISLPNYLVKTEKYSNHMNSDWNAMYYIYQWFDSTRILQTNGKLFQISE